MSICARCNQDHLYCNCRQGFLRMPLSDEQEEALKQVTKEAKAAARAAIRKAKKILFS